MSVDLNATKAVEECIETVPPLTMENIDQIGSILEPSVEIIATQVQAFYNSVETTVAIVALFITIIIALMSIFVYYNFFKPFRVRIDKIDKDIENEVSNQIIFTADEKIDSVKKFAIDKINYEIKHIKENANKKLFDYQNLVYLVNQHIKRESADFIASEELNSEQKLIKLVNLQYDYNEIVNHDLPKLFSEDVMIVKAAAEHFSEYEQIKSTIKEHLENIVENGQLSSSGKEEIKMVLQTHYNFDI